MILGREAVRILVLTGLLVGAAGACAFPTLLRPGNPFTPTPLALSRCDVDSGILCVVTFGMEPPDRMKIAILVPLGGIQEIHVYVESNGARTPYACHAAAASPRSFSCIGPSIPLGSTIRIDVSAGTAGTVVASGDFVLTALALPTVALGTPPSPGNAYPNP
jgi:hypothetical protein